MRSIGSVRAPSRLKRRPSHYLTGYGRRQITASGRHTCGRDDEGDQWRAQGDRHPPTPLQCRRGRSPRLTTAELAVTRPSRRQHEKSTQSRLSVDDLTAGFLFNDLPTKQEALIADADSAVLPLRRRWRRRLGRGGENVFHLRTVLAAEAAPPSLARSNGRETAGLSRRAQVSGDDSSGLVNAPIADVDARTSDELPAPALVRAAEGADEGLSVGGLASSPPATSAMGVHDLLDTLVAEAERRGDLSHGRSSQLQATDGVVILGLRDLGFSLCIRRPRTGFPGRAEQLFVEHHVV